MYAEIELSKSSFVAAIATKKKGPSSLPTDPLAPLKEDLRPWYSSKTGERDTEDGHKDKDDADGKRYVFSLWCVLELIYHFTSLRDAARKTGHDPLTSFNHQLSSQKPSTMYINKASAKCNLTSVEALQLFSYR